MGSYLDSINRKNAVEAAKQMSPEGVKKQAKEELDAMKAGGLVSRDGEYRQNFVGGGASKYFDRLTEAAKTGKIINGGGGGGDGSRAAGGVSGGGGGGGGPGAFAGPLTNSQLQTGFLIGGIQKPRLGASSPGGRSAEGVSGYDNPGYREQAPPPVSFTPTRLRWQPLRR